MGDALIWLLEWQTRIAIGGYEKITHLVPLEIIEQGVELLKGMETEKLEVSKQLIETIQTFF